METWLKNSLEGHESPIPIGGWKGLHQTRKKKDRQAYYWFLVASVLLFAGISIWQFGDFSPVTSPQSSQQTKPGRYPNTIEKEMISPETEIQPEEKTLVRPVPPIQPHVTQNQEEMGTEELNGIHSLVGAAPIMSIKPKAIMSKADRTNPALKQHSVQLQPRKRTGWTFFAETGMAYGKLDFAMYRNAVQEEYQTIVGESELIHREYTFGLGAYRQLFAHWSLGAGVQFVKSSMDGVLDYTQQGIVFDPSSVNNWQNNRTLIENNYRYAPNIHTWSLRIPLRLRYQLFEGNSPLLECGGNFTHTYRNTGNWIDPQSLEPLENRNNLANTNRFSPEFGLGYQFKIGSARLAAWYRFIPENRPYKTSGGSLETKLHSFSIQWQMSH